MKLSAKAIVGNLTIGLITTGGCLFFYKREPWGSLDSDHDFESKMDSDYSENKFGRKHKKHLLGLDKSNTTWWNFLFNRLQDDLHSLNSSWFNSTDTGKKITEGYGSNEYSSLNKVCEKAYKTELTNVDSEESRENPNKFKKEHVWKYCSPLSTVATAQENYPEVSKVNSIGEEIKDRLLSTKRKENDAAWEFLTQEFFKETGDKSGKTQEIKSSVFKDFYETNKDKREKN